MSPNYDELRKAHRDALDQHLEKQSPQVGQDAGTTGREPTRPENHPSQSQTPGWSADQSMPAQNASASRWAEAANEHQAAKAALREHEAGSTRDGPQKTQGADQRAEARQALEGHEAGGRTQEPSEREMVEARQGLKAEHEAALARKPDDIER